MGATFKPAVGDLKQVERARDALLSTVEGRTLIDVFMATCDANGGKPALVMKEGERFRTRTWAEYRHEASQVAMGLRRAGVDHGDFVALMMTNRPEHVIGDIGTLLAGATPVSVYNTLTVDQVAYIVDNCAAKVAIVEDAAFLARWLEVRAKVPALELLVVVDADGADLDQEGVISYADLLAQGAEALTTGAGELENSWRAIKPEDPATLIYTSGTTGPPKGVVITHRGLLFQLGVINELLDFQPGQRGVSYLPLAHVAERMTTHYVAIRFAGTVYFVQDVTAVLETLQEARPQTFMAVPRVWEKVHSRLLAKVHETEDERRRKLALKALEVGTAKVRAEMAGQRPSLGLRVQYALFDRLVFAKIRDGLGLDELRFALSGAAAISAELLIFFKAIGIEILEVYGMTESTAVMTANTPGAVRIGTVGPPLPGIEVTLADDGEILCRGPIVTPGYWNREEATREAIDDDGWLHTGDLGAVDEDGYFRIIGRKKELIITAGGKNLSPNNIEETIKQASPIIGQICAVGDDKPYIAALIVLDAEALPAWCTANGIDEAPIEQLAEHPEVLAEIERAVATGNRELARVEQVKRWSIVPSEWTAESEELTPSLKLKRRVVHEKYAAAIEELYAQPR